ncbi:MAG: hypothetical protein CMK07_12860 [Ponticaulis sp.]|nr:hypothetical protein [Ponticaulis sp.]
MEPYLNFAHNFTSNEGLAASLAWVFMIVAAGLILVVGFFICKFVASLIGSGIDKLPFMKKVNDDNVPGEESIGHAIGEVLFYLLFLFVIAIALSVVGLSSVIQPVEAMWGEILTYLPNVIAAIFILGLGLLLAAVVRKLVESVLTAIGLDSYTTGLVEKPNDTDANTPTVSNPVSSAIGWIAFTLIAIPVVLASVEALAIDSITVPVSMMLTSILEAIPRIFVALLILAIAFFIARFVAMLIERVLPQFGFDAYISKLGLLEPKAENGLTATKAVSTIVTIAILLIGAVEAAEVIGFAVLSEFVSIIIEQGGEILFGIVIIIAGFIFSNAAGRILDAAGTGASDIAAKVVKYTILIFFTIIGISAMRLDPTDGTFVIRIVEYLAIAIAVVIGVGGALAFGLGGREWAGRKLDQWSGRSPSSPTPTTTTRSRTTKKTTE